MKRWIDRFGRRREGQLDRGGFASSFAGRLDLRDRCVKRRPLVFVLTQKYLFKSLKAMLRRHFDAEYVYASSGSLGMNSVIAIYLLPTCVWCVKSGKREET